MDILTYYDDKRLAAIFKAYGLVYDPTVMRMLRTAFNMGGEAGMRKVVKMLRQLVQNLDLVEPLDIIR